MQPLSSASAASVLGAACWGVTAHVGREAEVAPALRTILSVCPAADTCWGAKIPREGSRSGVEDLDPRGRHEFCVLGCNRAASSV